MFAIKIPVLVPLEAVGKKLIDHPGITLGPFYTNDTSINFPRLHSHETENIYKNYSTGKTGILANIQGCGQCFMVSSKAEEKWPDVLIEIIPRIVKDQEKQIFHFSVVLGRPKSVGEFKLNTLAYIRGVRDDTQLAILDPNLLSHPDDVESMLEGIKFAFNIAENTTAFKKIGTSYDTIPIYACDNFVFCSDDYWKCYLAYTTRSRVHMIGTCSMGPDSDSSYNSVVDTKFRVRGVTNLRVVDASVMPEIPNANINAPVIMLAEKAADEIRKHWYTDTAGGS